MLYQDVGLVKEFFVFFLPCNLFKQLQTGAAVAGCGGGKKPVRARPNSPESTHRSTAKTISGRSPLRQCR